MEHGQIHHIEFYVDDLDKSKAFWEPSLALFGYKPVQSWSEGVSYGHSNGTYIVFVQVIEKHLGIKNNRQGQGFNHFALHGSSNKSFEQLETIIASKCGALLNKKQDYFCFQGPDGVVGEIFI